MYSLRRSTPDAQAAGGVMNEEQRRDVHPGGSILSAHGLGCYDSFIFLHNAPEIPVQ